MCGRAILVTSVTEIAEIFDVEPIDIGPPRFNLAPGQPAVVVRNQKRTEDGTIPGRELALLKWGLVPRWADSTKIGGRLVQARAETVATTPAYRGAFKFQRCLFVADGFYEWKAEGSSDPEKKAKSKVRIPYRLRRADEAPFAIAALWARWKSKDGDVLDSCAVVTTEARGVVATIHDRMPLVLDSDAQARWLAGNEEEAKALVAEAPAISAIEPFDAVPVSTWVNDVKHDDARCLEATAYEGAAQPSDQIRLRFD